MSKATPSLYLDELATVLQLGAKLSSELEKLGIPISVPFVKKERQGGKSRLTTYRQLFLLPAGMALTALYKDSIAKAKSYKCSASPATKQKPKKKTRPGARTRKLGKPREF